MAKFKPLSAIHSLNRSYAKVDDGAHAATGWITRVQGTASETHVVVQNMHQPAVELYFKCNPLQIAAAIARSKVKDRSFSRDRDQVLGLDETILVNYKTLPSAHESRRLFGFNPPASTPKLPTPLEVHQKRLSLNRGMEPN
jgi:hypothetical protein